LTALVKVTVDRSTGYSDIYLGIGDSEILRIDESSFEVVSFQHYQQIDANGTTKLVEELTSVYKRVE
jgi:hypothetical protein